MAKGSGASGRGSGRPRKIVAEPTEFGRLVKELRRGRGLSQQELARPAGISTGYIGMIETGLRGEKPSDKTVFGLADALGATWQETLALLRAGGFTRTEATRLMRERSHGPAEAPEPVRASEEPEEEPILLRGAGLDDVDEVIEAIRAADVLDLGVKLHNRSVQEGEYRTDYWVLEIYSAAPLRPSVWDDE